MEVAVTLVTRNGASFLPAALESLAKQDFRDFTVRVFDNGSTDDSRNLLRRWIGNYGGTMKRSPKNIGFAAAYNLLLRDGTEPFLFVMNQDVVLHRQYLGALVKQLRTSTSVGSTSGLLLRLEKGATGGLRMTHLIDACGLQLYATHRVVEGRRGCTAVTVTGSLVNVFGVPATAALYRREALEATALHRNLQAEYFDETFFAYKEDIDLAYRLQLAGWDATVVTGARAHHYRTLRGMRDAAMRYGGRHSIYSRRQTDSTLRFLSYRNHLFFLFGTAWPTVGVRVLFHTVVYEILKMLFLLLTETRTLRAWRSVFRAWPELQKKRGILRRYDHYERIRRWMI